MLVRLLAVSHRVERERLNPVEGGDLDATRSGPGRRGAEQERTIDRLLEEPRHVLDQLQTWLGGIASEGCHSTVPISSRSRTGLQAVASGSNASPSTARWTSILGVDQTFDSTRDSGVSSGASRFPSSSSASNSSRKCLRMSRRSPSSED